MSNEAKARNQIYLAVKEAATLELDFADDSTIHPYLKEYHNEAELSNYLMATVAGRKVVRAWGIQVLAQNEAVLQMTGEQYVRSYLITIRGYYELVKGPEVNLLIDHARKIRGVIKKLGLRLNGEMTVIDSISPITLSIENGESGRMIVGEINYTYLDQSPDY